ncbi:universal stress protein [Massilia sp. BSC265]|uniref:universal stress protein n=1 Tax=Massilia sp. BSC265 TaxID=1549812 RepID=UPI00068D9614|nr:universal stress protein [Massilia sp. BSC265]
MNDSTRAALPRRLLLATDLGVRGDRPLDRARQLALEWQAELVVLTVRDGPRTPEEVGAWLDREDSAQAFELAARRELDEEFAGSGLTPFLRVMDGDVTAAILAAAGALADAPVVLGASGEDGLGALFLGSTVERLSQELAQPMLVVRRRTRGPYARILVANDFSEASRRALEAAVRLFPERRIVLFHVLEALTGQVDGAVRAALAASERFLDGCALHEGVRERIVPLIGHGSVTDTIVRYAQEQALQLAVLGVDRRAGAARLFMDSRGDALLRQLPCDTLVVPAAEG